MTFIVGEEGRKGSSGRQGQRKDLVLLGGADDFLITVKRRKKLPRNMKGTTD